jgi:hypothetical protein
VLLSGSSLQREGEDGMTTLCTRCGFTAAEVAAQRGASAAHRGDGAGSMVATMCPRLGSLTSWEDPWSAKVDGGGATGAHWTMWFGLNGVP